MASTVRRPMPGIANTLSVTTAPPIRSAMPMPITVTIGTAAFFKACTNRMPYCPMPLARAVRARTDVFGERRMCRGRRQFGSQGEDRCDQLVYGRGRHREAEHRERHDE